MKYKRSISCIFIALLAFCSVYATGPSVIWKNIPAAAKQTAVLYPIAHAFKGSNNLAVITIWYSWDNLNWNLLISNSNPDNNNPYDPRGDFLGGGAYLSQSGTLYLKASVTDTTSQSDVEVVAIPVSASAGGYDTPSLLAARNSTYNYGVAWMNDSTDGKQKCWWTSGKAGGGDEIIYSEYPSSPPGTTTPTSVLSPTSPSNLISNPCVVKGALSNGYSYAMYTTVWNNTQNDIRVSFSNNGLSWTSPTVVITSQFNANTYNPDFIWGACIPSVMRVASNDYKMLYIDTENDGVGALYMTTSSDGIYWSGNKTRVSMNGLPDFGRQIGTLGNCPSVAYYIDSGTPYYYMAYSDTPNTITPNTKIYFYRIAASSVTSGNWEHRGTLSSTDTMHWKSNPGIFKDEDGWMTSASGVIGYATSPQYNHESGTTDYLNIWDSQLFYWVTP